MKRIKVIGIGSPFGNDQLGWQVIEQLKHSLPRNDVTHAPGDQQLNLLCSDRPGIRLLELMKDTDTLILVDAIDNRDCAGQLLEFDRSQLLHSGHALSSHALSVSEALSLAESLGDLPEKIMLFGICVDRSDSQPVHQQLIEKLCDNINHYIANVSYR